MKGNECIGKNEKRGDESEVSEVLRKEEGMDKGKTDADKWMFNGKRKYAV